MDKKTRLLILSQYFPPETGAPQARLSEMALLLKDRGIDVEILTAMPNYPAGKIFDGYKGKISCVENWKGIRIIRTFIYPTKNPKVIPRLLNYFSFVFSSLFIGAFRCTKPDIILVESPPLFLGISAYALKIIFGAKLIFNVSDLWPETAVALGLYQRESGLVRLATSMEKFFYKKADACTGQSFGITRGITEKYLPARVVHLPNGADCENFSPQKKNRAAVKKWVSADKIIVGYAGLIGIAQGIQLIIDTAQLLKDDPALVFLIVGDGPEYQMLEQQSKNLKNIVFTGLVPKEHMPEIVASFDMTIIPLKKHIPGALPSKIYEAMASEVPIILAAEGDPKELVHRAEAGLVVDYNNITLVAGAVEKLKNDPALRQSLGRNGRNYVSKHHQRAAIAHKLYNTLNALMSNDNSFFENEVTLH